MEGRSVCNMVTVIFPSSMLLFPVLSSAELCGRIDPVYAKGGMVGLGWCGANVPDLLSAAVVQAVRPQGGRNTVRISKSLRN